MTDSEDSIDITHLARLARLDVQDAALQDVQGELRNIIRMVDLMAAIDTTGVEPMSHPLAQAARLRSDEVTESVEREQFQAVAPETAEGYYLVPRVVE
ncbi:MAG: Asp-tRNA(Asn)/Glu-tRNA(Gln) amidotransferase subunit GatC [Pseudomonadota bacterium]